MFPSTLQHSIFQTTEALQMLVEWLTSLTWKKAEWMKGQWTGVLSPCANTREFLTAS
jgi:hypothetical protein